MNVKHISKMLDENELQKLRKICGYEAAKFIKNNSIVGLGTGRTAKCFIDALGKRINNGDLKNIIGVPTSRESEKYGLKKGIKIKDLNEIFEENLRIDVDVDGADMIAKDFSLIKGYGGALTREKIIAKSAENFICVIDETKISENLNKAIPIDVIPFAVNYVKDELRKRYNATCMMMKKKDNENFITNDGNFVILADFGEISNPERLEDELNLISGVVENGIFAKRRPDIVIVGGKEKVKILKKKK